MNRCSICSHPHVAHIDSLIAGGRSLRSIAMAMGVGADSLQRHVKNGHTARTGSPAVAMPRSADGTVEPLEDFRAQLRALDEIAASSPSLQLQVLEARRRVVADMARIAPGTGEAESITARKLRTAEELLVVYGDVIARHPDVRAEAAAALKAYKASRQSADG